MGCPICGRIYCDHTPSERGQSFGEMMGDCFTPVNNKKEEKIMKKYDFKIKIEGLKNKTMFSVEHDGTLDVESIESAAQEAIELAKKLSGKFTKCTLTIEEK